MFAIVFLSNVNAQLLSTVLKLEINFFFRMSRGFKVSYTYFSFSIYFESLSLKGTHFFFAGINFNLWYFAFMYNSLSIFINILKSLPLVSIFSIFYLLFSIILYLPIKSFLSSSSYLFGLTRCHAVNNCTYFSKTNKQKKKNKSASFRSLNSPHFGKWLSSGHLCKQLDGETD